MRCTIIATYISILYCFIFVIKFSLFFYYYFFFLSKCVYFFVYSMCDCIVLSFGYTIRCTHTHTHKSTQKHISSLRKNTVSSARGQRCRRSSCCRGYKLHAAESFGIIMLGPVRSHFHSLSHSLMRPTSTWQQGLSLSVILWPIATVVFTHVGQVNHCWWQTKYSQYCIYCYFFL